MYISVMLRYCIKRFYRDHSYLDELETGVGIFNDWSQSERIDGEESRLFELWCCINLGGVRDVELL